MKKHFNERSIISLRIVVANLICHLSVLVDDALRRKFRGKGIVTEKTEISDG